MVVGTRSRRTLGAKTRGSWSSNSENRTLVKWQRRMRKLDSDKSCRQGELKKGGPRSDHGQGGP